MRSKKILVLNPPGSNIYLRDYYCSHTSKARYYWGPYDLIVLSGILSQEFEVEALDAMMPRRSPQQVLAQLRSFDGEAIVFLTGAVSWEEDFSLLAEVAKKASRPLTLIGNGDILLAKTQEFLTRYPFLSAVIHDFTSGEIVRYLQGERGEFATLSYRENGSLHPARGALPKGDFSLPLPRLELFPYKQYRIPHGIRLPYAGILTDFGCPFRCDYCIGGELGFRLRDLDNILEEMRYLKRLGIRELWIKDLTFGANKRRTLELLDRMQREELSFTWVCLSRANVLDEELLQAMAAAGCHTIQLGVETASDELLSRYAKGVSRETVRRAVALCKQAKIRVLAHFILGLPGDSEENIHETINFALELDPEFASFNVAMPRMGTSFRERALKEGLINDNVETLDNSISYPVYDTPELSRERLWQLRNHAIRRFHLRPHFVLKRLFRVRSFYELSTLFREGLALLLTVRK